MQQLVVFSILELLPNSNKVPVLHKMPDHIYHHVAYTFHRDIVPRHLRAFMLIWQQACFNVLFNIVKVFNSRIRKIHSWPEFFSVVYVKKIVLLGIHPTKADIKAAHKSYFSINHNHFLVVGVQKWDFLRWVPEHLNVAREGLKVSFGVQRVIV